MLAGSMEVNKIRHIGSLQLSQDKDNQISFVLNRGPEIERSAGVIRARAVNVKSSACDHRAMPYRLLPLIAEADFLVIIKSTICRCC
ncbi:hypothetical protein T01_12693 [Trichinella spiralis]|uniref:Uncharacterized protein n=1 Tax=Trichinella spiralis TaxID=6334 RepID=A0A0V1AQN6_TRISP|nr:hypothetical protein T01_12693 [Trichinella spiralis]